MNLLTAAKDSWRKNSEELLGLFNGALPEFVTASRPRPLDGVPVFHFHLVEASVFDADLAFLAANGYRTLSGEEFVRYLNGEQKIVDRAVLLTFDDGPRNFFDVAFPLLEKYQARAVAFIAPGLHREAGPDDATDARPMTWQEIRTIKDSGLVEFQSHTFQSCIVAKWPLAAELSGCDPAIEARRRHAVLPLDEDLALSQREIASWLGDVRVDQLAFPQYIGTTASLDTARSLGFRACYWGLLPGRPVNRPGDSPFRVSRVSEEFLRRLPGKGRASFGAIARTRLERIREGRAWRRRFPSTG